MYSIYIILSNIYKQPIESIISFISNEIDYYKYVLINNKIYIYYETNNIYKPIYNI